jgi:hypothetical protein
MKVARPDDASGQQARRIEPVEVFELSLASRWGCLQI